jgi:hypothetical protein
MSWMRRQVLAVERKRVDTTERAHAAEVSRLREALEAVRAERAHLRTELAQTREALGAARVEGEHWKAAAHSHERRADEAVKGLQDTQASSVRQLNLLQEQLQAVLARAPVRRRSRSD